MLTPKDPQWKTAHAVPSFEGVISTWCNDVLMVVQEEASRTWTIVEDCERDSVDPFDHQLIINYDTGEEADRVFIQIEGKKIIVGAAVVPEGAMTDIIERKEVALSRRGDFVGQLLFNMLVETRKKAGRSVGKL